MRAAAAFTAATHPSAPCLEVIIKWSSFRRKAMGAAAACAAALSVAPFLDVAPFLA